MLATIFYNSDKAMLLLLNRQRSPVGDIIWLNLTNATGFIAYGTAIVALTLSIFTGNKALKTKGFAIAVAGVFSLLASTALKYIVHRPRPFNVLKTIQVLGPAGGWSYPSGHTCDAFFLAAILFLIFPNRKWLIFTAYSWAILVGFSRIYLGAHYPSDVLGGIAIGSSMSVLAYYLMIDHPGQHKSRSRS